MANRLTPSDMNVNAMSGEESASFSQTDATAAASVLSCFRNLRRAGTFEKSSETVTAVPSGQPASDTVEQTPYVTFIE